MSMSLDEFRRRAARVKLLAFDVDGTLTDAGIYLGVTEELKRFDVRDGAGLALARDAGLHLALITGRSSESVTRRAAELRIKEVHQGVREKVSVLRHVGERLNVLPEEMLFMGDDLPDLAVMSFVGVAAAPLDAVAAVREISWVSQHRAGFGAAREVCEIVLEAQGKLAGLIAEQRAKGRTLTQ